MEIDFQLEPEFLPVIFSKYSKRLLEIYRGINFMSALVKCIPNFQ